MDINREATSETS